MQSVDVATPRRECLVDITDHIGEAVRQTGCREGVCTVYVPHTTAGITINENADPDVRRDMLAFFSQLVPRDWGFRHAEGNSDAHIKASMMGFSVQIPVARGRLALGTWQGVYLAEFDGPRNRQVLTVVMGS